MLGRLAGQAGRKLRRIRIQEYDEPDSLGRIAREYVSPPKPILTESQKTWEAVKSRGVDSLEPQETRSMALPQKQTPIAKLLQEEIEKPIANKKATRWDIEKMSVGNRYVQPPGFAAPKKLGESVISEAIKNPIAKDKVKEHYQNKLKQYVDNLAKDTNMLKEIQKHKKEDDMYKFISQSTYGTQPDIIASMNKEREKYSPGHTERQLFEFERGANRNPFLQGLLESTTPLGIIWGDKQGLRNVKERELGMKANVDTAYNSAAFKAGDVVGTMATYPLTRGFGIESAILRKGLPIVEKALPAFTKAFPKLGPFTKEFLLRRVADAAGGLPINITQSIGASKDPKDFLKNILVNTGLDVAAGSAFTTPGMVKKAIKNNREISAGAISNALEQRSKNRMHIPPHIEPPTLKGMASELGEIQRLKGMARELEDVPKKTHLEVPKFKMNEPVEAPKFKMNEPVEVPKFKMNEPPKFVEPNNPIETPSLETGTKGVNLQTNLSDKEFLEKFKSLTAEQQSRLLKADYSIMDRLVKGLPSEEPKISTQGLEKPVMPTAKVEQPVSLEQPFKALKESQPKSLNKMLPKPLVDSPSASLFPTPTEMTWDAAREKTYKKYQSDGVYKGTTPMYAKGEPVTKAVDTAYRGGITDEARTINRNHLLQGELDFTKSSHEKLLKGAEIRVAENPQAVIDELKKFAENPAGATEKDIANGAAVIEYAQKIKDPQLEAKAVETTSFMLTELGKGVSAGKLLLRTTPTGRLRATFKMAESLGKKYDVPIKLSDKIKERILKATTDKEKSEALEAASVSIWNQIPASFGEKINAWRYMAMLTNPKTHSRNITGNLFFAVARRAKNMMAAGLEGGAEKFGKLEKGERTKSVFTNKEDISFGKNDFEQVRSTILSGTSKYTDATRPLESKVFNTKGLEKVRKISGKTLDLEDSITLKSAYADSMARFMRSNGYTAADMTGDTLAKGRTIAKNEALKATYRDYSKIAAWINKSKHVPIVGNAVDVAVPFVKTPVNIMRRGFDYSPIGLIKGVTKVATAKTPNQLVKAIDDISSGLTGSMIFGLGWYLEDKGIIKVELPEGKEGAYSKDLGDMKFSVKVGDTSVTFDWAVPFSMPFAMGGLTGKTVKEGGENVMDDVGLIIDASTKIFDPAMELTAVQGITNVYNAGKYAQSPAQAVVGMAGAAGNMYLNQFIPTAVKQMARFVDPVQRSTKSTSDSFSGKMIDRTLLGLRQSMPFVSKLNEPTVDVWGREKVDERPTWQRALETFLSPAYVKKDKSTSVDKEIKRLKSATDDDMVIPSIFNKNKLKFEGKDERLKRADITTYNKAKGEKAFSELSDLMSTDSYNNMSDAEKVSAIQGIFSDSGKHAKRETLISRGADAWKVYRDDLKGGKLAQSYAAEQAGISPNVYFEILKIENSLADGKRGWSKSDAVKALANAELTPEQKATMWKAFNKSWNGRTSGEGRSSKGNSGRSSSGRRSSGGSTSRSSSGGGTSRRSSSIASRANTSVASTKSEQAFKNLRKGGTSKLIEAADIPKVRKLKRASRKAIYKALMKNLS